MDKYYKIKEEKVSEYHSLDKSFIKFPSTLSELNLSRENGMYYHWRLKEKSQDEMIMTKIKLEDLEEVNV